MAERLFAREIPRIRIFVLSVTFRFANSCYDHQVRIFVHLPDGINPTFSVLERAYDILLKTGIRSARLGGFINESGVVLIDPAEAPKAVQVLTRAGLRAVTD
jgi:hypothetical protein